MPFCCCKVVFSCVYIADNDLMMKPEDTVIVTISDVY